MTVSNAQSILGRPVAVRPALAEQVRGHVHAALAQQPIWDVHTHLYPPAFGTPVPCDDAALDANGLMLWGIDEMLTYHYLVAELFRYTEEEELTYAQFWQMPKREQADLIWRKLFVERMPVSEAAQGVLTTLHRLGLDIQGDSLQSIRAWFAQQEPNQYIDMVMETSRVARITMTNDVFDANERTRWLDNGPGLTDERFATVMRIDPMLRDWSSAVKTINALGYSVAPALDDASIAEAQRFMEDWLSRLDAVYCAMSLPPTFAYPSPGASADAVSQRVLDQVILPVCERLGKPLALMIGSQLEVNPALRDAGAIAGKTDVRSIANLCHAYPNVRFLCTMLSRENQHELGVVARKFRNLMIFGCWWFLNTPMLVEEITRMRMDLLGSSFIPQHSDARVLDQLIYKWDHTRHVLQKVLTDRMCALASRGVDVNRRAVEKEVRHLLFDNVREFLNVEA